MGKRASQVARFERFLPKHEPQEDARVGGGGVFIPGGAVAPGIGHGVGDVSGKLADLIIHS